MGGGLHPLRDRPEQEWALKGEVGEDVDPVDVIG